MSCESDKPSPVRVHIVVSEKDNGSADDVHYCGKCKLAFTSIKDYMVHKVSHDSCQVTYTRSLKDKRMLVPNIQPKPTKASGDSLSTEQDEKKVRRKVKRDLPDESLITEKVTYSCSLCDHSFSRVAALKRHMDYDHVAVEQEEMTSADNVTDTEMVEDEGVIEGELDTANVSKWINDKVPGKEKPFVCSLCGHEFKLANVLKTHLLTHTNKRDFICSEPDCGCAFKTKGSLTRHMRRHTGEKPHCCHLCGRSFSESGALRRHLKSRISCEKKTDADLPRYGKRWGLEEGRHVMINRSVPEGSPEDGTPVLPLTSKDNDTPEQVAIANDTEIMTEEITTETSVNENDVEMEAVESTVENEPVVDAENTCKVCHVSFERVEELKDHLRIHLADSKIRCDACHFVADSKMELVLHQQSIHDMATVATPGIINSLNTNEADKISRDAKIAVQQIIGLLEPRDENLPSSVGKNNKSLQKFTCLICEKTFKGHRQLRLHMNGHTGERDYKCGYCAKTFTSKVVLQKHEIVHIEDKHYKCGDCGKLFKRISHVRDHLKIHSGERPFECGVCSKRFKTANAAKVHSRTHSNVLPYKCKYCDRSFREKGSLQRHTRLHTGEKPFKCNRCGRCFAEHGTLSRHLKSKVPCYKRGSTNVDGYPTVLSEFSSVVADTQQYIVPKNLHQISPEGEQLTEFVVVDASEIPVETLQNVEIIASGDTEGSEGVDEENQENCQYVVVEGDSGGNFQVFNQQTGQTITTINLVNMPNPEEETLILQQTVLDSDNTQGQLLQQVVLDSDNTQGQLLQQTVLESDNTQGQLLQQVVLDSDNTQGQLLQQTVLESDNTQSQLLQQTVLDSDNTRGQLLQQTVLDSDNNRGQLLQQTVLDSDNTRGQLLQQTVLDSDNTQEQIYFVPAAEQTPMSE